MILKQRGEYQKMTTNCLNVLSQDRLNRKQQVRMSTVVFLSQEKMKGHDLKNFNSNEKIEKEILKGVVDENLFELSSIHKSIQDNVKMVFEYLS